jgi:hypothetical protein
MEAILPQHLAASCQRDRILNLLVAAHGGEVPSYELAKIALQYNARVKELRALGHVIRNRTERVNGQVHGYFRLEESRSQLPAPNSELSRSRQSEGSATTDFLFNDWSPRHVDLG